MFAYPSMEKCVSREKKKDAENSKVAHIVEDTRRDKLATLRTLIIQDMQSSKGDKHHSDKAYSNPESTCLRKDTSGRSGRWRQLDTQPKLPTAADILVDTPPADIRVDTRPAKIAVPDLNSSKMNCLQIQRSKGDKCHSEMTSSKLESVADMEVVDWGDLESVIDHNKNMLVKQIACDVEFIVGGNEDRIGAHRYVLINASTVFRNMFAGTGESGCQHYVPHISVENFREFLMHAYCGGGKLEVTNVVDILYAADRFAMIKLRETCLTFLHDCLEADNAIYLRDEVKRYGYSEEEKSIVSFLGQMGKYIQATEEKSRTLKTESVEEWGLKTPQEERKEDFEKQKSVVEILVNSVSVCQDSSDPNGMDTSRSRNLPEDSTALNSSLSMTEETDSVSAASSQECISSSPPSDPQYTSSSNVENVVQITRLRDVSKSDFNDGSTPDVISFTVSRNIYLHGFSIYGPKKQGGAKYRVDTVLSCKRKDLIVESYHVKGSDVILPVMFEDPVKIDKKCRYTLEIYITGPESHMGTSGQTKIKCASVLFTFDDAQKVKGNRTNTTRGQIPRLYFQFREK